MAYLFLLAILSIIALIVIAVPLDDGNGDDDLPIKF